MQLLFDVDDMPCLHADYDDQQQDHHGEYYLLRTALF
jgi:hypothetical protein